MKPTVTFLPWQTRRDEVLAIEVEDTQKRFLAQPSVAEFLVDDAEHPTFTSYALTVGQTVVGFACYGREEAHEPGKAWIPLVVIDRRFQGQGLGRAALVAIIDRIQTDCPGCHAIGLSCARENAIAMHLYATLGFRTVGGSSEGETELWLTCGDRTSGRG